MANHRNRFPARRRFLKQSTALSATVALPSLARAAQPAPQPLQETDTRAAPPTEAPQPAQTPQLAQPAQPAHPAPVRRTREPRR